MFTAVAHKNLADAEGYFDEHFSQNDYYAAGEIRPGQWIGVGAERLGLSGGQNVSRQQFYAAAVEVVPHVRHRKFIQSILKRGQRFLKQFHQQLSQGKGIKQIREPSYEQQRQSQRSISV